MAACEITRNALPRNSTEAFDLILLKKCLDVFGDWVSGASANAHGCAQLPSHRFSFTEAELVETLEETVSQPIEYPAVIRRSNHLGIGDDDFLPQLHHTVPHFADLVAHTAQASNT